MSTSTTVNDLKINVLTKAQYDTSSKSSTELWMVTDDTYYDVQVDTLPTADASCLDKIYQYTGTTDANYTNGYFYKCVSDGQSTPTYSWTQVNVQPGSSGGNYLPLTGGTLTGDLEISNGYSIKFPGTSGTYTQKITNSSNTCISFQSTYSSSWGLLMDLGRAEIRGMYSGYGKLGSANYHWGEGYINDLYTTKINNGNDISVPTVAGSMAVQVSSMPTAAAGLVGQIYQYTGADTLDVEIKQTHKNAGSQKISNLTIDKNTFIQKVNSVPGVYKFHYYMGWYDGDYTLESRSTSVNISQYGVSYTGYPIENDEITIVYGVLEDGYTNGYFYKCVDNEIATKTATGTQKTGSSLSNITINVNTFSDGVLNVPGTYNFYCDGYMWYLATKATHDMNNRIYDGLSTTYGITFSGTPVEDDEIEVIYVDNPGGIVWEAISTQKGYSAGDGVNVEDNIISLDDDVLRNQADPTKTSNSFVIGNDTDINNNCNNSVALGSNTQIWTGNSIAVGYHATTAGGTDAGSIAIGNQTYASGTNSIVIGNGGYLGQNNVILLTSGGRPNNLNSMSTQSLYVKTNSSTGPAYQLMNSSGNVPAARLADTTSATSGQVLQLDSNLNAVWATPQAGSSTLSNLTDVTITSASSGQVLSYNGTNWENSDPTPAMVIVDYTAS